MKLRQSASSLYEQIRTHHSKPLNERNKRGPQLALRALEKEYGDVVKKSVYKTEVLARAKGLPSKGKTRKADKADAKAPAMTEAEVEETARSPAIGAILVAEVQVATSAAESASRLLTERKHELLAASGLVLEAKENLIECGASTAARAVTIETTRQWQQEALEQVVRPMRGEKVDALQHALRMLPCTYLGAFHASIEHALAQPASVTPAGAAAQEAGHGADPARTARTSSMVTRELSACFSSIVSTFSSGGWHTCELCQDVASPGSAAAATKAAAGGGLSHLCRWLPGVCNSPVHGCWSLRGLAPRRLALHELCLQPLPAFQWLGLEEDASSHDVTQAYRQLSRLHHPDRGGSTAAFGLTNDCHKLLRDQVHASWPRVEPWGDARRERADRVLDACGSHGPGRRAGGSRTVEKQPLTRPGTACAGPPRGLPAGAQPRRVRTAAGAVG